MKYKMISKEDNTVSEVIGYSGKRYISSLNGKEFSEAYKVLECCAEKCLIKKIKSIPKKLRKPIETRQGIICAPIKNHFELEIILTGTSLF